MVVSYFFSPRRDGGFARAFRERFRHTTTNLSFSLFFYPIISVFLLLLASSLPMLSLSLRLARVCVCVFYPTCFSGSARGPSLGSQRFTRPHVAMRVAFFSLVLLLLYDFDPILRNFIPALSGQHHQRAILVLRPCYLRCTPYRSPHIISPLCRSLHFFSSPSFSTQSTGFRVCARLLTTLAPFNFPSSVLIAAGVIPDFDRGVCRAHAPLPCHSTGCRDATSSSAELHPQQKKYTAFPP